LKVNIILIPINSVTPFFRQDRHNVKDIKTKRKLKKGTGKYRDRQIVKWLIR